MRCLGLRLIGALIGSSTALPIGSYELCGWLTDQSNAVTISYQGAFSVTPADTVALRLPTPAVEGRGFDVDANGNAYDANALIDATYKPAGGACGPTPASDAGTVADNNGIAPGPGQYTQPVISQPVLSAGSYLVCAWLVDSQTADVLAFAFTSNSAQNLRCTTGTVHFSVHTS